MTRDNGEENETDGLMNVVHGEVSEAAMRTSYRP